MHSCPYVYIYLHRFHPCTADTLLGDSQGKDKDSVQLNFSDVAVSLQTVAVVVTVVSSLHDRRWRRHGTANSMQPETRMIIPDI